MESMVEENGNSSLEPLGGAEVPSATSDGSSPQQHTSSATTILTTTAANIVHFIPTQNIQVNFVCLMELIII